MENITIVYRIQTSRNRYDIWLGNKTGFTGGEIGYYQWLTTVFSYAVINRFSIRSPNRRIQDKGWCNIAQGNRISGTIQLRTKTAMVFPIAFNRI